MQEVEAAAKAANAHAFISQLPEGYDTQVRWRGRGGRSACLMLFHSIN